MSIRFVMLFSLTAACASQGRPAAVTPAGPTGDVNTTSAGPTGEVAQAKATPAETPGGKHMLSTYAAQRSSNPDFAKAFDQRTAALGDAAPTAEQCAEVPSLIATVPVGTPACQPGKAGCAMPSDHPESYRKPAQPAWAHGCTVPQGSVVDLGDGMKGLSNAATTAYEGCSAAYESWLIQRCPAM